MSSSAWSFHNPVRIVIQPGLVDRLEEHVHYQRILLVTSPGFRRRGVVARLEAGLGERLIGVLDNVAPNPDVRDIDAQALAVRPLRPDAVLALGGGSSIDTAKALARLLAQPAESLLVAHFRDAVPLSNAPALPVIAMPTTGGTGAEVTPFGTVWDFERGRKYSLAGEDLYPAQAILDPELTLGLPEEVTLASGLDALSHALESAWNRNANPITQGLVTQSLQLSLRALPSLCAGPNDLQLRSSIMQASLLAGLAISQTRTALAHSISYPLTARFDIPHGIACSFTLPALWRFNVQADDGRLQRLAISLGFSDSAAFATRLQTLFSELEVGRRVLRSLPQPEAVLEWVDEMITPGRADNNLRDATVADVEGIVREALEMAARDYAVQP